MSDPIAGPEGFHIVQLKHAESVEPSRSALRQSWAAAVLTAERARVEMEQILAARTAYRIDPALLLR